MPTKTPRHVLSRCVFIPKKFPTLLAEREIIANAIISPDFSPNRVQRYKVFMEQPSHLPQKQQNEHDF